MYLGFILWAIILVVILWNISPALVITSALIGVVLAIGKTKDNKSGEEYGDFKRSIFEEISAIRKSVAGVRRG